MKCRHCGTALSLTFLDLGSAPPSNVHLTECDLQSPERWYPLRILVCQECWLVQTEDYAEAREIITDDYAYFSSYSGSWLERCEKYVARMVERFHLGRQCFVIELAANEGYLLQYVAGSKISCLGTEPTGVTAASARAKGIEIIGKFFGVCLVRNLAGASRYADLVAANNVLAHVPDINDFVSGIASLLKPTGVATFEFPHLLNLLAYSQFDAIYHELYSYLSLLSVRRIFERNGLSVFDVEEFPTHEGSLRVYAQREGGPHPMSQAVESLLQRELSAGLMSTSHYTNFQARADKVKNDFLSFLLMARREGKSVAAYGAAAKCNTLLNYAGIRSDLLPYVADNNPAKRNKFLPGSRIPIVSEDRIRKEHPDYVVILPSNLRDQVMADLRYIRDWGGRFVTAAPHLELGY